MVAPRHSLDLEEMEATRLKMRVHGGGATATLGATRHTMYGDLDSHIVDAAPRARLTEEESLARDVARRRELEADRRHRIFDSKRRIIGVDKDALDAQVEEKQRRRQEERRASREHDLQVLEVNKHLKLLELEQRRSHKAMHQECKDHSLRHLNFESRREFDLNDPLANRKASAARVSDDDERCGPASLQQFSGEDLNADERRRQQRIAQADFIEQQRFEKGMLNRIAQDEERRVAEEYQQMCEARAQNEDNEKLTRRELLKGVQDENAAQAKEKAELRAMDRHLEQMMNSKELDHHNRDHFLNETVPHFVDGRVRTDHFKGTVRADREMVKNEQILQAEDKAAQNNRLRDQKKWQEQQDEITRKKLVFRERENQRLRRQMLENVSLQNNAMRAERKHNTKRDMTYRNTIAPEFFEQFGTSTR